MNIKEHIIHQAEKESCPPKNKDEFSFRRQQYFLIETLEKKYLKSTQPDKNHLNKILRDEYWSRGFEKEDIENYLVALSNKDSSGRKKVFIKVANKFEQAGRLIYAAENYFEADKTEKAAELLIKEGNQSFTGGKEFLWAADCLIQGGVNEQQAYLRMSEELKKMITIRKKELEPTLAFNNSYGYLGECLHRAGQREEALKAFINSEYEKSDKLRAGKNYCVRIKDWLGAAKFKKEMVDHHYNNDHDSYIELAEYYYKAGLRKEEAKTLWTAKDYLDAAKVFFEIEKDNRYFLEAGKAYDSIGSQRVGYFRTEVWNWIKRSCNDIYHHHSVNKIDKIHQLFTCLYSAYSLPLPQKISFKSEETIKTHKETAIKLYDEFQKKRQLTKKDAQIKKLLSDNNLVIALEHAVLGNIEIYRIKNILEKAFKGVSCPRPIESNLNPEMQKLWLKAKEEEIISIGYDPIKMAGRAYEEGGYYKEAKGRYLRIHLLDDAYRMDKSIKKDSKKNI